MVVNDLPVLGKTLVEIVRDDVDGDRLTFKTSDGEIYRMFHYQDCCERVSIEDICGDLDDLLGSPLCIAEEVRKRGDNPDVESETWTFYKFATVAGAVTIRWYGRSNGYYSEAVSFVKDDE